MSSGEREGAGTTACMRQGTAAHGACGDQGGVGLMKEGGGAYKKGWI